MSWKERCDGVTSPDEPTVRPIFESAFRAFGLPSAMRSDNGPPFASTALGRLSRLSNQETPQKRPPEP